MPHENCKCGFRTPLTVADGIKIQQEHLDGWKRVLKPEVCEQLEVQLVLQAGTARCGHEVMRGTDIDSLLVRIRDGKTT